MSEWIYNNTAVTDDIVDGYIGFVYIIRNLISGKAYIGKKRLTKKTTKPPLKGTKRKRVTITSSDWRNYFGSNDDLLADVKELGSDKFERKILRLCKSLGECSYFEAKYQFSSDCILSEEYYNHWISVRVRKNHLKGLDYEIDSTSTDAGSL